MVEDGIFKVARELCVEPGPAGAADSSATPTAAGTRGDLAINILFEQLQSSARTVPSSKHTRAIKS